jgi:hypothetical protein
MSNLALVNSEANFGALAAAMGMQADTSSKEKASVLPRLRMTNEEIKAYASSLGYAFTDEDCADIIGTSYEGETVEHAVNDFLDAFER